MKKQLEIMKIKAQTFEKDRLNNRMDTLQYELVS